MNLYLLSYFAWEDSDSIILYHEQDYSDMEFKKFCDEAFESEEVEYHEDAADYLVEYYGFKYPLVKQYYVNEGDVRIIEDGRI